MKFSTIGCFVERGRTGTEAKRVSCYFTTALSPGSKGFEALRRNFAMLDERGFTGERD